MISGTASASSPTRCFPAQLAVPLFRTILFDPQEGSATMCIQIMSRYVPAA